MSFDPNEMKMRLEMDLPRILRKDITTATELFAKYSTLGSITKPETRTYFEEVLRTLAATRTALEEAAGNLHGSAGGLIAQPATPEHDVKEGPLTEALAAAKFVSTVERAERAISDGVVEVKLLAADGYEKLEEPPELLLTGCTYFVTVGETEGVLNVS